MRQYYDLNSPVNVNFEKCSYLEKKEKEQGKKEKDGKKRPRIEIKIFKFVLKQLMFIAILGRFQTQSYLEETRVFKAG